MRSAMKGIISVYVGREDNSFDIMMTDAIRLYLTCHHLPDVGKMVISTGLSKKRLVTLLRLAGMEEK